ILWRRARSSVPLVFSRCIKRAPQKALFKVFIFQIFVSFFAILNCAERQFSIRTTLMLIESVDTTTSEVNESHKNLTAPIGQNICGFVEWMPSVLRKKPFRSAFQNFLAWF
ncbi:MAG: hypothetical protein WAN42_20430, partial [Pseudolabrys sp.]